MWFDKPLGKKRYLGLYPESWQIIIAIVAGAIIGLLWAIGDIRQWWP